MFLRNYFVITSAEPIQLIGEKLRRNSDRQPHLPAGQQTLCDEELAEPVQIGAEAPERKNVAGESKGSHEESQGRGVPALLQDRLSHSDFRNLDLSTMAEHLLHTPHP